ncbi:hypothetical protein IQ268_09595 [Oculatella sp. LEGE 06141]|uniref:hypothetical protein n=1 Tax=Oculatella sp. LEGE 06141 TaxID=1828648 RepID=UPI0018830916|nr:hypothetical protein [Oculatella sp. LEGE 06141]MBE9178812.1 hypothetical protein [Oculatella sp. LEGE 06141]
MYTRQAPSSKIQSNRVDRTTDSFKTDWQGWLHPPSGFVNALAEAIAWMGAAAAVRLSLGVLLTASSPFWLPVVLLLIAPAIAAAYLSTLMPQMSLILGYRSVLLMLGLLIGGRL